MSIDHIKWGKKILEYLVRHIRGFKGGNKHIAYSDLAKAIGYPEPYTGNLFGNNIGKTLGEMGHMFDNIILKEWPGEIPLIQTLVVSKTKKIPSDGLKEFNKTYPRLSDEKKKDFAKNEYQRIFEFGERWNLVLEKLKIKKKLGTDSKMHINKTRKIIKYNPYGSEGSPEHRKLRDYIAEHPELFGVQSIGITEYPLKSGDSIDVVFEDEKNVFAIEVKSIRSGNDDIERGIFQCIKYHAVLKAEELVSQKNRHLKRFLVIEDDLESKLKSITHKLNVKILKVSVNK